MVNTKSIFSTAKISNEWNPKVVEHCNWGII